MSSMATSAAVRTDQGDIAADTVVIACGVWSPRIARMAGASIPLTPAVHQMIDIGPVPQFEHTTKEVGFPIVRDMDTNMYERQHGTGFEIGSYAHRAILMDADDIPSIEASALSPTMLPFTKEDFDPQLEDSLELFPEIVGDETVGVKLAINGLLSLTPDGNPIIGETPEVKGLWSAAAIWIKEAPGIAKAVAEWMTTGKPEIDPHGSDIARFYDHHKTAAAHRRRGRPRASTRPTASSTRWSSGRSNRPIRLSPAYDRHVELGAEFFEAAGWERPYWYGTNESLLGEYGDRVMPRQAEWESRWWSPIINAEHLAMRDRAGLVDLSAFAIFDIVGPGALAALERLCVNKIDVTPGRTVYTPLLNAAGGILADLTVMRLANDRFRVVTGGGMGMRDRKIFQDAMPDDGSAQLHDVTNCVHDVRPVGPASPRHPRRSVRRRADISHKGFPFLTSKIDRHRRRPDPRLADQLRRRARVGRSTSRSSRACGSGTRSGEPGSRTASSRSGSARTPSRRGSRRATGRMAPSSSSTSTWSRPAWPDRRSRTPTSSVARRTCSKRDETPAAVLCTLTVDDNTSKSGVKRYMLGREPILAQDGSPLVDAKGRRSYVTSAGSGPSVGKHLLMSYLPPDQAVEGNKLLVEYFGERYPVTVAVAGATPLFDPENERIRS